MIYNQVNSIIQKRYKLDAATARQTTTTCFDESDLRKFRTEEDVHRYLDELEELGK